LEEPPAVPTNPYRVRRGVAKLLRVSRIELDRRVTQRKAIVEKLIKPIGDSDVEQARAADRRPRCEWPIVDSAAALAGREHRRRSREADGNDGKLAKPEKPIEIHQN
jgi:hypothetical protein